MTRVTTLDAGLPARRCCAYAGDWIKMPRTMIWLATVIRVAVAPVLVGALVLVVESARSPSDLAVAAGLVLLGATHVLYWWQPWPTRPRRAVAVLAVMVTI